MNRRPMTPPLHEDDAVPVPCASSCWLAVQTDQQLMLSGLCSAAVTHLYACAGVLIARTRCDQRCRSQVGPAGSGVCEGAGELAQHGAEQTGEAVIEFIPVRCQAPHHLQPHRVAEGAQHGRQIEGFGLGLGQCTLGRRKGRTLPGRPGQAGPETLRGFRCDRSAAQDRLRRRQSARLTAAGPHPGSDERAGRNPARGRKREP